VRHVLGRCVAFLTVLLPVTAHSPLAGFLTVVLTAVGHIRWLLHSVATLLCSLSLHSSLFQYFYFTDMNYCVCTWGARLFADALYGGCAVVSLPVGGSGVCVTNAINLVNLTTL
jgi:hypothetical protein